MRPSFNVRKTRIASLRAVAVIALALPRRKIAAARLAYGWVRLLKRRPPEILFCGASVSTTR